MIKEVTRFFPSGFFSQHKEVMNDRAGQRMEMIFTYSNKCHTAFYKGKQ